MIRTCMGGEDSIRSPLKMLSSAVGVALFGALLILFGYLTQLIPAYLGPDLRLMMFFVPLVFALGSFGVSAVFAVWGALWLAFEVFLLLVDKLNE